VAIDCPERADCWIAMMAIQQPNSQNLQVMTIIAVAIGFVSASQDIASDAYRTDVIEELEMAAVAVQFKVAWALLP
jgi:MFS transporter, PAT family, beta-lactamase induction signal transducer AmpG